MLLKRQVVLLLSFLLLLLMTGCAKGDITLDLQKIGQADVSCRILMAPALVVPLEQVKEDFRQDQFQVTDIREDDWTGFVAERHFDKVRDVKDIHLFQSTKKSVGTADKAPTSSPAEKKDAAVQSEITTERGWFVDHYKIDATLHLDRQLPVKKAEEKQLITFLLSQIKLNFIVKLPVMPASSNAGEVRDDGKTLVWPISLTSATHIQAEATVVNWPRVGGLGLLIAAVAVAVWRRRSICRKRKGASEV